MTDVLTILTALMTILSYMLTNFLYLRVFLIISAIPDIISGFINDYHHITSVKLTIICGFIFILINLIQIIKMLLDRVPVFMPADLKALYYKMFSKMTPKEFMLLYKLSKIQNLEQGIHLTEQNKPVKELIIILEGSVNIIKNDKIVKILGSDFFIGEMSFLSSDKASATTVTNNKVKCITWSPKTLHDLEEDNQILYDKLKNVIAINLIKKLVEMNEKTEHVHKT